jgi:hypothetical protein
MREPHINGASGIALIVLSLTALLTVLIGYTQLPQPDEGAGAAYLSAVDRGPGAGARRFPRHGGLDAASRSARPLALSSTAVVLAFGALYYLEHYYS